MSFNDCRKERGEGYFERERDIRIREREKNIHTSRDGVERERESKIYGFPKEWKEDDIPEHAGELPDGMRIVGQPANTYSINTT